MRGAEGFINTAGDSERQHKIKMTTTESEHERRNSSDEPLPNMKIPRLNSMNSDDGNEDQQPVQRNSPPTISPRLASVGNLPIQNTHLKKSLTKDGRNDEDTEEDDSANITDTNATSVESSYLPSDSGGIPADIIGALSNPSIEDDSPAAEALRANANVHVNSLGKFARRIQVQNVRRMFKRGLFIGNKRGKPPKLAPHRITDDSGGIYNIQEESEDDDGAGSNDGTASIAANTHGSRLSSQGDRSDFCVEHEPVPAPTDEKKKVGWQGVATTVEKVPHEVMSGTMETGRKCTYQKNFIAL